MCEWKLNVSCQYDSTYVLVLGWSYRSLFLRLKHAAFDCDSPLRSIIAHTSVHLSIHQPKGNCPWLAPYTCVSQYGLQLLITTKRSLINQERPNELLKERKGCTNRNMSHNRAKNVSCWTWPFLGFSHTSFWTQLVGWQTLVIAELHEFVWVCDRQLSWQTIPTCAGFTMDQWQFQPTKR